MGLTCLTLNILSWGCDIAMCITTVYNRSIRQEILYHSRSFGMEVSPMHPELNLSSVIIYYDSYIMTDMSKQGKISDK